MRFPSAPALQRATVAGIAGAGVALVGLSVSGFAGLDSNLRAATEQQQAPGLHQTRDIRFARHRVGGCDGPWHRPSRPAGDATTTGAHQPT
jgi:hypothetical protein